jgi:hypothetical protein
MRLSRSLDGAEPWAIIFAGLTVVVIAVALWRYNTGRAARPAPWWRAQSWGDTIDPNEIDRP